jgi:hypothetical protein
MSGFINVIKRKGGGGGRKRRLYNQDLKHIQKLYIAIVVHHLGAAATIHSDKSME